LQFAVETPPLNDVPLPAENEAFPFAVEDEASIK
jgi:hypothetical protein